MKKILRFLLVAGCSLLVLRAPHAADFNQALTNGGGNLTSFTNQQGAVNNNQYNQMMNPSRAGGSGGVAAANFGNCDALIQRCASPRCANGGCADMSVTLPIVQGCVAANNDCKKHGDALAQSVAAQIVASNTAKAKQAAEQQAAAETAAMQQQMTQQQAAMQQQMTAMQQQMAEQQAASAQQMQEALAAQAAQAAQTQQILAAQAAQPAPAAAPVAAAPAQISESQMETAIDRGVSADVIARQQIIGQVMSSLDGVDAGIKSLKKTVDDVLTYADCDYNAGSCTGPKRIAAFRAKARAFFEPYDSVLDSLENSLFTAMAAGIDISDIYMMLNNSCSQWGKYACTEQNARPLQYCPNGAKSIIEEPENITVGEESITRLVWYCEGVATASGARVRAYANKTTGYEKQFANPQCQLTGLFRNDQRDEIQQNWILSMEDNPTHIRMACISDGIFAGGILGGRRSRKKSNDFDIDALEMIINREEPKLPKSDMNPLNYCAKNSDIQINIDSLQTALNSNKFDNILVGTKAEGSEEIITNATCLDTEGYNCVADPLYAMCNVHAYNINIKTNNEIEDDVKQQMNDLIALKSTVIARQLKKQYDYLVVTVKQMKTQLQRAVMTAQAEAAGAESGNSSSSNNGLVSGQIDCRGKSRAEVITCVRNNISGLQQMANNSNLSDFKKAITPNIQAINGVSESVEGEECTGQLTSKNMTPCLIKINAALQRLTDAENGNKRQSGGRADGE